MAAIQLPAAASAGAILDRPQYRVLVKPSWTAAWEAFPYLEALTAGDVAGPSIPRAQFRWRAGDIKWEDQQAFAVQQAVDLKMKFVRIDLLPPPDSRRSARLNQSTLWVGRFYEEELESFGSDQQDQVDQPMVAHGLAHELDRIQIDTSVITNDGTAGARIRNVLSFNDHYIKGYQEVGNRSAAKVAQSIGGIQRHAYAFANAADGDYLRYVWSVRDIIEYLLQFFAPPWANWTLAGVGNVLDTLDQIKPPGVKADGKTIFTLLNELIDRKRGLGWRLKAVEATASDPNTQRALQVEVFSVVDQNVAFGDAVLAANPTAQTVNVSDLGHLVATDRLALDTLATYDRIIISGQRILVCFTVSFTDSTLQTGWSHALESDYKAGGTGTDSTKKDQERSTDKFDRVYSRFLIPSTWNWMAGDGEGGDKKNANINCDVDGRIYPTSRGGVPPAIRNWGAVMSRSLPLVQLRETSPTDLDLEYRETFALVKVPGDGTNPGRYVYAEATQDEVGHGGHVRTLDRDFGIHVHFRINHILALNHWTGGGTDKTAASNRPVYDYRDLIATVAARTDTNLCCIVDIATNRPDPNLEPQRILYIDVPDAETWWIVPGTVTDVQDGQLKKKTGSTDSDFILRDDSPRLRAIGALAKAWYAKPRASMTLTLNEIAQHLPVGTFVQALVDGWRAEPINAPVTAVVYDLQSMETTITTNFCELDPHGALHPVLGGALSTITKQSIR